MEIHHNMYFWAPIGILIAGALKALFSAAAYVPADEDPEESRKRLLACRLVCLFLDAVTGIFVLLFDLQLYFTVRYTFHLPDLLFYIIAVLVLLFVLFLSYIFCELVPEALADEGAAQRFPAFRTVCRIAALLSAPALRFGTFVTDQLSQNMGIEPKHSIRHRVDTSTDIILESTDGDIKNIEADEKEMLSSVIDFNKNVVRRVMIPRNEMNCVPEDVSFEELLGIITKTGHSRIPVYKEDVDHIIGIVHAKAMLGVSSGASFDIRSIIKNVMFVPETKEAHELLNEFREKGEHMAIVTDEYGGTSGLITVEDLLEEIVGDIADEYDQMDDPVSHNAGEPVRVEASAAIDEINDEYGLKLPLSDEYNSVAGLVIENYGDIPTRGQQVTIGGYTVTVLEVSEGKILSVEIRPDNVYENE